MARVCKEGEPGAPGEKGKAKDWAADDSKHRPETKLPRWFIVSTGQGRKGVTERWK